MPQFDVLLVFASSDRPASRQLAEALRRRGLKVWFDEWEVKPGDLLAQKLQQGIALAGSVAALIGPKSETDTKAIASLMLKRPGSKIIPVLLPGASSAQIPLLLKAISYVDLQGGLESSALDRLIWGITGRQPITVEHSAHPARLKSVTIPNALAKALIDKRCVLFAGNGVAMANGYPGWYDLLNQIAESSAAKPIPIVRSSFLGEALAESLGEAMPSHVAKAYRRNREGEPAKLLKDLAALPFAGLINANWDDSLETLCGVSPAKSRIFDDFEKMEASSQGEFFSIKLWGDLKRPASVVLTGSQLAKHLRHPLVQRYFTSLLANYSLFFVGSSLESVQEFLDYFAGFASGGIQHFALLPVEDEPSEQYLRGFLQKRYSVTLLGFDPTDDFAAAGDFVARLAEDKRDLLEANGTLEAPPASVNGSGEPVILQSVSLRDIGPFRELDLDFKPGWNLLLGNNGCGKSSVLRAIAHALASDEPEAQSGIATRGLLRAGARSGKIELRGEKLKWMTELFREGDSTRTFPGPRPPFQKGRSVVLGFPALRGISSTNPRGPMSDGPKSPQIADLLPLIQASADFRLDSSKQWIVNAWARSQHNLLTKYFAVLRDLTPGVEFALSRVDTQTWSVLVTTPDGEVPLDFLSQGTSSIISWVGVLLERLYEMHPELEDPTQEAALVLIDEIDAHMHPEWQQAMVPLLRKHFPRLQVIATTHSPLLLGSFDASEVYQFQRDPESHQIQVERIKTSFLGWRTDQILTSPAFGLETTVSQDAERWLSEYGTLMAKESPTPENRARIAELDALISRHMPTHPETQLQRDALEGLNAYLTGQLVDKPAVEKQRIVAEAEKMLLQLRADK